MAQVSPYFRTEEEKEQLVKLRDEFGERFSAPPPRNLTIVVAGPQGTGKTHLVCTMAGTEYGPVYIGDSEHRAQTVVAKFKSLEPELPLHRATVTNYPDTVAFVKWAKQSLTPPAVIVLDSGSDIDKFAEEQYLIHEGKEVVGKPINHPRMNRYVYALMDELKFSGFTVVLTSKMKDEYVGENRSGRLLPRLFKDIPYRADLMVELHGEKRFITKSGWTRLQYAEIPSEITTLPDIITFAKSLDSLQVVVTPGGILAGEGDTKNNGGKKIIGR